MGTGTYCTIKLLCVCVLMYSLQAISELGTVKRQTLMYCIIVKQ